MGEDPGRSRRVRWSAAAAVAACAVVAAIAGGTVLRSPADTDQQLDVAEATGGELPALVLEQGDELPNGFVVADGTTVPGGVVPEQGDISAATFTSSSVQIEVPGDMATAVRAYLDQAIELGYSLVARNEDDACWDQPLEIADGTPPPAEPALARMHCGVTGTRPTPEGQAQVHLEAHRTYPVPDLDPVNSLRIGFVASNVPPTSAWRSIAPSALPEPGTGPPAPEVPLGFPGALDPLCGPALEVVQGSRILAVAGDCGRSSRVALAVTGDPEQVYAAYVQQVRQVAPAHAGTDSRVYHPLELHGSGASATGRAVRVHVATWDGELIWVRMQEGDGVHAPTLWIEHAPG